MNVTTLSDYRDRIRTMGNFPTTDTRVTDSMIDMAVNKALRRIALTHDWPWLDDDDEILLVDGVEEYPLPPSFLRSKSLVRESDGYPLSFRTPEEISESSGRLAYSIYKGNLLISFPPGDVGELLKHRYVVIEKQLTEDLETARIPDYWNDGVVYAALSEIYLWIKHPDEAAAQEAAFKQWVVDSQDNINQTKSTLRVRVRPGSFI